MTGYTSLTAGLYKVGKVTKFTFETHLAKILKLAILLCLVLVLVDRDKKDKTIFSTLKCCFYSFCNRLPLLIAKNISTSTEEKSREMDGGGPTARKLSIDFQTTSHLSWWSSLSHELWHNHGRNWQVSKSCGKNKISSPIPLYWRRASKCYTFILLFPMALATLSSFLGTPVQFSHLLRIAADI